MKNILFIICFLLHSSIRPQYFNIVNQQVIGTSKFDATSGFIKAKNNGYIFGSSTDNVGVSYDKSCGNFGDSDAWLVKVDDNLNKEWDLCYGGTFNDYPIDVLKTDNGYLLVCSSRSGISGNKTIPKVSPSTGSDTWLVKIDMNGNILNQKAISGIHDGDLYAAAKMPSGYLLGMTCRPQAGNDQSENGEGVTDYWIVRLDEDLNIQWDKCYGGSSTEQVHEIEIFDQYIYVLGASGSNQSFDKSEDNYSPLSNFWLLKLDFNGNKIWDRTFGSASTFGCYGVGYFAINNSQIVIAAPSMCPAGGTQTASPISNNSNKNIWITSINHDGVILKDVFYGSTEGEDIADIVPFGIDHFFVLGSTQASNSGSVSDSSFGQWDIWIFEIDNDLNMLQQRLIGGSSDDFGRQIILNQNKLMVSSRSDSPVSGLKTKPKKGGFDVWLLEIELNTSSLENKELSNLLNLHPNPSSGTLYINQKWEGSEFQIFTVDGKFIKSGIASSLINLEMLDNGFYMIKILDSQTKPIVSRFIIQK